MEILNAILKRYINFSLLELSLFSLFGLVIYYILQIPSFLPFLDSASGQKDINNFPANAFFIIFWFLLFFLAKKVVDSIFRYIFSFRKYNFRSEDWPSKWEYQGNIRLWESEENSLYITDSNSGCILNHYYWKNLEISFECMFPETADDQTLGIIFRAKSLSDYLMIQINDKEKQIVPHIRMEGRWETPRQPKYDLTFEKNVFFNVRLRILNEKVELFINGNSYLDWIIPTNSDIVLVTNESQHRSDTIVPKIDFRKSYGRIGFRAYQGENAVVKNLSVRRIAGIL